MMHLLLLFFYFFNHYHHHYHPFLSAYFDVEESDCSAWADAEEVETIFDVGFHRVVVSYLGGAIQSLTHDRCILFSSGLFPRFQSWMRHTRFGIRLLDSSGLRML